MYISMLNVENLVELKLISPTFCTPGTLSKILSSIYRHFPSSSATDISQLTVEYLFICFSVTESKIHFNWRKEG